MKKKKKVIDTSKNCRLSNIVVTENIKRKFSTACRRKHSTMNAVLKKFMIEYSSPTVQADSSPTP